MPNSVLAPPRRVLEEMVESRGGLPMHLDGAPMTCRKQQAGRDHRTVRERLDQASEITP